MAAGEAERLRARASDIAEAVVLRDSSDPKRSASCFWFCWSSHAITLSNWSRRGLALPSTRKCWIQMSTTSDFPSLPAGKVPRKGLVAALVQMPQNSVLAATQGCVGEFPEVHIWRESPPRENRRRKEKKGSS